MSEKCPHCEHEQDGFLVVTVDQTENGHDIEAAICESCRAVVDDMTSCPHCGGTGLDIDDTPCPECDGEGIKYWLC